MNDERWARTYAAVMGVEVWPPGKGKYWLWKEKDRRPKTIANGRAVPPLDANAIFGEDGLLERMQADGWEWKAFSDIEGACYMIWPIGRQDKELSVATAPHYREAAGEAIAQAMEIKE